MGISHDQTVPLFCPKKWIDSDTNDTLTPSLVEEASKLNTSPVQVSAYTEQYHTIIVIPSQTYVAGIKDAAIGRRMICSDCIMYDSLS